MLPKDSDFSFKYFLLYIGIKGAAGFSGDSTKLSRQTALQFNRFD